jgi:hypothetical protein
MRGVRWASSHRLSSVPSTIERRQEGERQGISSKCQSSRFPYSAGSAPAKLPGVSPW